MTYIEKDGWVLLDTDGKTPIALNATVQSFRGEKFTLKGGQPPQDAAASGHVYVIRKANKQGQNYEVFFPSVFGLLWKPIEDVNKR